MKGEVINNAFDPAVSDQRFWFLKPVPYLAPGHILETRGG